MVDVSFPYLSDHVFHLSKNLPFTLFGVSIAWYGAIICFGILVSAAYGLYLAPRRYGIPLTDIWEFLIFAFPSVYIGARLYYVIYQWDYYSQHLSEILNLKNGGLAIYGGVIGGALCVFIFYYRRGDVLSGLDIGAICILIGQIIGRWGNFVNGEAHGVETTLPWGMSIDGAAPVHPTFLYESLWNLCLFIILHLRSKHRKFRSELMLWYIAGYGLGRSWIEGLRTDSLYLWGTSIRVSQLLAFLSFVISMAVLIYFYVSGNHPQPWHPPANARVGFFNARDAAKEQKKKEASKNVSSMPAESAPKTKHKHNNKKRR